MLDNQMIHYNRKEIPLYVKREKLSYRLNSQTMPHWHEDIELLSVLKGKMYCKINNEKVALDEGDCLVISSLMMHYCYTDDESDCTYNRILFHPELLTRNKTIVSQVIDPVLSNGSIRFYHLPKNKKDTLAIAAMIEKIMQIHDENRLSRELEIIGYLHIVFSRLYNSDRRVQEVIKSQIDPDLHAQREMIQFIHEHFDEKISLEEIASAGNVCRSKCCQLFKKYIQKTPINFLNLYRLEVSRDMLKNSSSTISSISQSCGFSNQSYFNKLFLEEYKQTPAAFRAANA